MADQDRVTVQVALDRSQVDSIDRLQAMRGFPSTEVAVRWLLDVAIETVSGTGRRFWDRRLLSDAPAEQAQALADRLRAEGHTTQADRLHDATAGERIGNAVLEELRETCHTVLTTIEALDPKTQMMAEELRLEMDKLLAP